jgi:shikimate kinase
LKIYLVGFMGAGKTSVGRELAGRLAVPFLDLDEIVESAEDMSIREIFAEKGEPYFRKRERDLLRTTKYVENAVIATGGGTFAFEDNITFIKAEGYSVHLAAPFPVLQSRISEKAAERPLFRDDAATFELFQSRLKFYRMCDLSLDIGQDENVNEVVERLLMILPREARNGMRVRG